MTAPKCYIVNKNIDGYIASKFGYVAKGKFRGMNPTKVASLRGLYDEEAERTGSEPLLPDDYTQEDLDKAAEKLMKFRTAIREVNRVKLAKGTKHIDRAYDALRHAFSPEERKSRVNLLSNLFSWEVDRLTRNSNTDRQSLVNGFITIDGQYVGGEAAILEGVYNRIMQYRANWYRHYKNPEKAFEAFKRNKKFNYVGAPQTAEEFQRECLHRYNEYTKILECWNELIPFVLKDLVKKEGVKLGIKKEFASAASSDSFGENDIAAKWDMSESKRDGWMENSDLQSSFGSVGQQVRRILATVPQVEVRPVFKEVNTADGGKKRVFSHMESIPVVDDLGNQKFLDATKTHQALMEFLTGPENSDEMLKKMCKEGKPGEAKIPWMQPIVDILVSNPQARTQFFCDFKKNKQLYSSMWEDEDTKRKLHLPNAVRLIKTKILNKSKNMAKAKYDLTISSRGKFPVNVKMWGYKTVFDEKTKAVDWQRLAELRKTVLAWVYDDTVQTIAGQKVYGGGPVPLTNNRRDAVMKVDGKLVPVTFEMRREFLMEVFTSLGYDVTVDTIDSILTSRDIFTVREQLEYLFNPDNQETGILFAAHKKTLGATNVQNLQKEFDEGRKTFKDLYNQETTSGQVVREHSEKLLDIISKHQEGYRIESRARYQGNTMYSFVSPSFLGDRLETIQHFVESNDKDGLRQYLEEEYLQSPFFVNDAWLAGEHNTKNILNLWLSELYSACDKSPKSPTLLDSVAAIFSYERDLGSEDKKFEDFTSREHGIDMLVHFFADEQQKKGYGGKGSRDIRKKLSAMYPVFILGDAGVSKYIRAPRINSAVWADENGNVVEAESKARKHVEYRFDAAAQDRIIEQFWNIYLQERRRMAMDEAMAYEMYANGKKVKHPKGEFSILTFLNPNSQDYKEEYAIPTRRNPETGEVELDDTQENVSKIIRKYLNDATQNFKQRMQNLGVLETVKQGKNKEVYKYLSMITSPEELNSTDGKDKIQEFFWNTKLATACQLQMMTIDPSFYHGTKDLQKRYKEIHAPGTVLDVMARNPFSGNYELFCPERTIIRNGVPVKIAAGTETYVYFDDISVNSEETNPEFMEMILRNYAQPGVDVDALIAGKFHMKAIGEEAEEKRQKVLKAALGSNYEIYKTYCKNTLTDGQGYRTLRSYRMTHGMSGRWSRQQEDAFNAIEEIRRRHEVRDASGRVIDHTEITPEERKQIIEFALVLQPEKPYMFGHEKLPIKIAKKDKNGKTVMGTDGKPLMIDSYQYIPVQHKYAEALIIPELMPKGSKLRDLAYWMDEHNVDMVGSTKIAKVGCFGQADISKVENKTDLDAAMDKAYIHDIPYKNFRIQTNVPEHINSSQLFGTQVRKLIMAGLDMVNGYYESYLEGVGNFSGTVNLSTDNNATNDAVKLEGRNLLALYNSLICANIFDSYEKFAQNAGNIEELSNLLQQCTVGSMREAMDNLFAYVVTGQEEHLQKFMIPLFEGGLEHDAAALILSTFKKIVNKQQISGGSAVQVSAFGIDGYERDGNLRYVVDPDNKANILYAEIEMPFDKTFLIDMRDAKGNVTKQKVNLSFDKYCFPDGNLRPSKKKIEKEGKDGKTNREWKKYQSYTYKEVDGKLVPCKHDDPEAEVYKPLIETEYPDILSILAYRIPTERDYSMINCQIKRFTPKTAGGTMKVPPEGTSIAGFDFDIDKLYFMLREYHKHYKDSSYTESNFSEPQKRKIWEAIYTQNPEISRALDEAQAAAMLRDPENHANIIHRADGSTKIRPKNRKNSYWEEAKIEERFGVKKGELFAKTAQSEGITPSQNVVKGEVIEWMEEYDFSKAPEENTRAARNNLLITLIQARLMDPETAKQRYTPGGFANASKAARLMRELLHGDLSSVFNGTTVDMAALEQRQDSATDPEPNYDPTDPYTILIYNQQNQVAGKLIGIFANQNTNHAFASSMDVFELNKPIEFCGHSFKDFLHKGDKEEAARIDLNMAEFLAASVDAVKDPVLNFLNLNTLTADAGAMLARLGYTTKEIGLLFNQPIIHKVCQESFNKGINIKNAIENARNGLLDHITGYNPNQKVSISENDLAMGIVGERMMIERGKTREDYLADNAKMQYAVLNLFADIIKASQDVSNFVLSTKFTASNAVSSTMGGMYAQQMKVQEYVDRFAKGEKDENSLAYKMVVAPTAKGTGLMAQPIENGSDLLLQSNEKLSDYKKRYLHYVRFNPFAYEQAMFDANRNAIKLLSRYFPYERPMYSDIRNRMQKLALYGTLSEDDINDIHSNIPVALLAKQSDSPFNGEAAHVKNGEEMNMTNREYYRERFARDLADKLIEHPELMELEIFKYLSPESYDIDMGTNPETGRKNKPKEAWKITIQDVGGMDADVKEAIRESWAYLMKAKDTGYFDSQDFAELGRDLFMYCYYQLGFDFSPLSFMHLAPVAVKDSIRVDRSQSLTMRPYDPSEKSKDDVVVWSPNVVGGYERAVDYGANRSVEGELTSNSFQLPEDLTIAAIEDLINEAKSHPELTFKIDRDFSPEEFRKFTKSFIGRDVPSNIKFSSGTLDNPENRAIIPEISYGKTRTYRQFLNEILDGTEQGLNEEEFAQMWILNHLDNKRFVLDINKSNDRMRTILLGGKDEKGNPVTGLLQEPGNTLKDGFNFRERIVIDVSRFADNANDIEALINLATFNVQDNKLVEAKWAPCLCINGSYYIAESSTDMGFNLNKDYKITYRKVIPWGSSKTMEYDEGQKLSPAMRYQTSMNAEPQRNKDYVEPVDEIPMEAPAQTIASNSSQYSAAVHEALEAVKPQGADWSAVEEAVLNVDGIYHLQVWPVLARTVPNWRSITEEQKRAIADALIEYNTPSQPSDNNNEGSPEPLIDQSNGNTSGLGALRQILEESVFNEYYQSMVKYGYIIPERVEETRAHIQDMKNKLASSSDQEILDEVDKIRRGCRENGVLMMNEQGDFVEGC